MVTLNKTAIVFFTTIGTMASGLGEPALKAQESPQDFPEADIEIVVPALILDQPLYTPFRGEGTVRESSRPAYVIDREEIEAQGAITVQEALKYLPGLQSDGTAGGQLGARSSLFSRGLRTTQVLILLDGRPINDFNGGSFDLSNITTNNIQRIEYIPGGGSTLYGSSAVGGIVNIITGAPSDEFQATGELEFGSFGYDRQTIGFSGTNGRIGYSIGYNRIQSDNDFPFQLNTVDIRGDRENAEADYDNFDGKLEAKIGDRHTLTISALYLQKKIGVPGGFPVPGSAAGEFNSLSPDDSQESKDFLGDLTWQSQLGQGDDSLLTFKVYTDSLERKNQFNSAFFGEGERTFDRQAFGVQATHSWQFAPNQTITYGGDFRNTTAKSTTLTFSTGENVENYDENLSQGALFALYNIEVTPALSFNLGLRQDFNNLSDSSPTSPSIGTSLAITDSTVLRANYTESFRTPTAVDLFFPGFSNPDLKPERGRSFDVGIDQSLGKIGLLRLTFFTNRVEDAIIFNSATSIPENVGEVKTEGLETSLNLRLAKNVYLFGNYTINNTEIKDDPNATVIGNELNFTDANSFNTGIAYETPKGLYVGLLVHSIGKRFTTIANTEELPSYTTLDLKVRVPISHTFTVSASWDNILDEDYEVYPGVPGISSNFRLGVRSRF